MTGNTNRFLYNATTTRRSNNKITSLSINKTEINDKFTYNTEIASLSIYKAENTRFTRQNIHARKFIIMLKLTITQKFYSFIAVSDINNLLCGHL